MENEKEKTPLLDDKISQTTYEFEQEKERKIVNLLIEIIVASTLKEYHEKSN